MRNKRVFRLLQDARLAISGAVLGAAFAGMFFPNTASLSAAGAIAGFTAVLAVKIAHII